MVTALECKPEHREYCYRKIPFNKIFYTAVWINNLDIPVSFKNTKETRNESEQR